MAGKSRKKQASSSSPARPPEPNDPSPLPIQTMDPEEELNVSRNLQGELEEVAKEDDVDDGNDGNDPDAGIPTGQAAPVMSSARPRTEQARRSTQSQPSPTRSRSSSAHSVQPPSRGAVHVSSDSRALRSPLRAYVEPAQDRNEVELEADKLITMLSNLMVEFTAPFPDLKADIGMNLFRSSSLWSDELILQLSKEHASYIVSMLKNIGTLKMEGSLSPKEKLLAFKRVVDRDGYEPTTILYPGSSSKRPVQPSRNTVEQPPSQLTATGRRDHRGMPVMAMTMNQMAAERKARTVTEQHDPSALVTKPQPRLPASGLPRSGSRRDETYIVPAKTEERQVAMDNDPDDDDDDESSDSDDDNIRQNRQPRLRGRRHHVGDNDDTDERLSRESSLKLAIQMFARNDSKWSGPSDTNLSTDEFVQHFLDIMDICDATNRIRMKVLPFALKDDALDEYNQNIREDVRAGKFKSAKGIVLAISRNLETAEFKMSNKNLWTSMTLQDVRSNGESLERSFARLKKRARKLQSRLGGDYRSDSIFCDFFRRALQDEPFWTYVDDSDPNITSEILFSKVNLAIQRFQREDNRSVRRTETMTTDMTNRRFGTPDRKRIVRHRNPKYRNGTVMECTGCGSKDHLYKECRNPNKAEYREKKLEQINSMRRKDRKSYIRSYCMQFSDEDEESNGEDKDTDESDIEGIRDMAEELKSSLHESMFLETMPVEDNMKPVFDECMTMQTKHVFFGTTSRTQDTRRIGLRKGNRSFSQKLRYPSSLFPGIMIDNGSTGSLCSEAQLQAYRSFTGHPTPVRPLKNHYAVSAHGGSKCIGIATFKFPYHDTVIEFEAPIVENSDIPLILGLDDQDKFKSAGVDQKSDTISFFDGPPMSVERDRGHLWIRWKYEDECLFTEKELTKLHYRFGHPGLKRMHEFLKRACPEKVDKDTRAMLENIQARCKECQYLAPKPYVVKVAVPREDIVFNSEVVIDIMWIQGKHVLHVVDKATHFMAARFIPDDSTETIWRTFLQMWVLVYLGPPDNLRHDQGTQFVSPKLQAMAAEAGISCRPVGVEGPNAMGVGERYHDPLRKTFLKLQKTYQMPALNQEVPEGQKGPGRPRKNPRKVTRSVNIDDEFLLAISVMAMNTTVGPEGICPILLVFGAMPKLPLPESGPAAVPQAERMMMLETAREEYINLVAKIRLKQSEKAFIPSRPPPTLEYGDKVLVYREAVKRWEPRKFVSRNENHVIISEPNGDVQPYPITKVSEFKEGVFLPRPDIYGLDKEKSDGGAKRPQLVPVTAMGQDETSKGPDVSKRPTSTDLTLDEPAPDGAISEPISDNRPKEPNPTEAFALEIENDMTVEVSSPLESFHTVVLSHNDPRRKGFKEAIEAEVKGLFENNTFIVVKRSDFSYEELDGMTILKAKLVLAYKDADTPNEKQKARLVVQAVGKIDKDKRLLFTYSPTVTKASVRIMLSIPTKKGLKVFLRDISQAYVSSDKKLLREIYITPPKELGLSPDIMWKVIRPLYGLPESGVIWFETYIAHHHDKLKMKSSEVDPCLLYRKDKNSQVDGLICLQVDDSIGAGTQKFIDEETKASKCFKTRPASLLENGVELKFNGHYIKRNGTVLHLHQHPYEDRVPESKIERSAESFMTNRGKAAYLTSCTRPDVACAVNQLSQVKASLATEEDFKRLDKVFQQLRNERVELLYGNVDLDTAEVFVFADAAFATNLDLSSQLGFIALLVDQDRNCSIITWSSTKCRRVTRSVLAAELYALASGYDMGYAIAHTFSIILGRKVDLRVFTDSRTLFDSIITFCSMTEKRLLIDIACLRQSYRNGDLANLGWIKGEHNVADALTKDKANNSLHDVLRNHKLHFEVQQWISDGMIPPKGQRASF